MVWGVAALAVLAVLVVDLNTPASLAVGTILSVPVAFAALGSSPRAVPAFTAAAVLANLTAGIWNAARDGLNPTYLGNRAVSILAVLLVGFLAVKAREASDRVAAVRHEQRELASERVRRQLAEELGGPLGQAEFVQRAAGALLRLTGARRVEIGAVEAARLRPPVARALAPAEPAGDLDVRLPPEVLTPPLGSPDLWTTPQGQVTRLRRPAGGDLLVIVTAPQTPSAMTAVALQALPPLLERTALLDDLRQNRAQLEERGELLRDLIYAFSHDLRTPLLANAMNMNAALRGAYGPLPEAYRATLDNGLQANESLLALADQLIMVAKYEGGERPADDPETVRLREVVLSAVRDLRPRSEARHVTVDPHLDGVSVTGDRHALRRAVQNLLDNAVKFSPPGETVIVSLTADRDHARLCVTDRGPGITAERQARLFQRFRGYGAGSGTGLGLYLTRRIAEAHGGTVTYARTSQAQSVFTLTLPLVDPDA